MSDNWSVFETSFNPHQLRAKETIFTIGNGNFCTRGAYEESYPGDTPATLGCWIYDDIPTYQSELVNLPNWLWLQVSVAGEPLRMDRGEVLAYHRSLNLYTGCLSRRITWRSPRQHTLEFQWDRWISLADPYAMGIRLAVRSLDFSGKLEFSAGIDGHADNAGVMHWDFLAQGPFEGNGGYLHLQTKNTGIQICQAFAFVVRNEEDVFLEQQANPWCPSVQVVTEIHPGQTATAEKLVCLQSSRHLAGPVEEDSGDRLAASTLSHLRKMVNQGYEQIFRQSKDAWAEEWEDCAVAIEGDPGVELAARFGLYQLLIAAPRHVPYGGVCDRGLSGFGQCGHIFGDSELYVLPYFLHTRPEYARRMLLYRYHTLPGARAKAKEKGYAGSMFAWESAATGDEMTPRWMPEPNEVELERIWTADLSIYVTAGVAWAVDRYWQATRDDAFIRDYGAEIVLDTAHFWESRVEWNDEHQYFELTDVMGPDEFHMHVSNNAFTNYLSKRNLEIALDVWEWLVREWPEKAEKLAGSLGLSDANFQRWKYIAANFLLPRNPKTHLIEQFDGYFDLTEINIEDLEPRLQSLQVVLGLQNSHKCQITRRPDVLMLLYLFKDLLTRQEAQAHWEYYVKRTDLTHGTSFGYSIHAALAARLGKPDLAYRNLRSAGLVDLADVLGETATGIHTGNAGGIWQALVFGFAGLEPAGDDGYSLRPCLPPHWTKLAFTIYLAGKRHRVEITNSIDQPRVEPPVFAYPEPKNLLVDWPPASSDLAVEPGKPQPTLDGLPGMEYVGLADAQRTMVKVNSYCFNLTGWHPAELIKGRLFGSMIHPFDRSFVLSELQEARREDRPYQVIYRLLTASQQDKWVLEYGRPLPDEAASGAQRSLFAGRIIELTGRITEYAVLSEYAERLETLREIDQIILGAQSTPEIIYTALRAIHRLAPSLHLILFLLNSPEQQAEIFSTVKRSQEITTEVIQLTPEMSRWWSSLCEATKGRQDFSVHPKGINPGDDPQPAALVRRLAEYNHLIPLRFQGGWIGVLGLGSEKQDSHLISLLGMAAEVADSLAIGITQRRLKDQLRLANQNLQTLSRRLVEVQEQERRFLAKELHDEIGQSLTVIKINLERMGKPPTAKAQKRLEDTIQVVGQTLQQVRNLSLDLRPALLDELGLLATLRWYVDRLAQLNNVKAVFHTTLKEDYLPTEIETTLFRVAQEALTNVLRHSGAKQIDVSLNQGDGEITLSIRDDGRGFEVPETLQAVAMGSSLGLLSIQERLHLIGGQLEIRSAPGLGTEILTSVPFSEGRFIGKEKAAPAVDLEKPLRVLLVEDHTLVREGIRSILEEIPGVQVIGEAGDGQAAMQMVASKRPDLVIMDIAMPVMNGLQIAEKISEAYPMIKVLILSMHNSGEFVLKALKSGTVGYMLKDATTTELKLAIEAIARGEVYLSPGISRQVVSDYVSYANGRPDPLNTLTPRQRQVLKLIAEGFTTKEIAKELKISVSSVETHRMHLMDRLDIHDIAGLVRFAFKSGLISINS